MDIVRLALYVLAPWFPFLFRNWLYKFKVWQILLLSVVSLLPFGFTFVSIYSFSTSFLFSVSFILFLISLSTICWLLTANRRFIVFASLMNLPTILMFYSANWQTSPYHTEAGKPERSILNVVSNEYADIEAIYVLRDLEVYHARKMVLGGILAKKYELNLVNKSDTCLYKGYDYDRGKIFYWNKCNNKITGS